jgi:hypothetical protein
MDAAVLLQPVGHEEMAVLRYDLVFALMLLRIDGTLAEDVWLEKLCASGIPFLYEWFVGMVELMEKQGYIRQLATGIPEGLGLTELSKRLTWTLTERGCLLFGDDFEDEEEQLPLPLPSERRERAVDGEREGQQDPEPTRSTLER